MAFLGVRTAVHQRVLRRFVAAFQGDADVDCHLSVTQNHYPVLRPRRHEGIRLLCHLETTELIIDFDIDAGAVKSELMALPPGHHTSVGSSDRTRSSLWISGAFLERPAQAKALLLAAVEIVERHERPAQVVAVSSSSSSSSSGSPLAIAARR